MTTKRERGAAMIVVLIVMAALMTAGGLAIYVSTSETRSTGYVASGRQALYCAEAGLAAARETITSNYASWNLLLDDNDQNDPSWYPVAGYMDSTTSGDPHYEVRIRDNNDEVSPVPNDTTADTDMQIYIESTCLLYPDTPRSVTEMIQYSSSGHTYRNQAGQGGGNTGNSN